jgi:DNA replicative helicase MCM subunit Mcm2 (Cdc46/Mcm family)
MIQETNSLLSEDGGVIFGTNISTSKVMGELERFIREFEVAQAQGGDSSANEKYYYQKLSDYGLDIGSDVFEVKGTHLKEFNQEIYYQFIYFPAEMISCFDAVLKTLYELFFISN